LSARGSRETTIIEVRLARYPTQLIQQVAQATDIVELISQYVALKKRGKEFVGLCPFHDDHKPSLNVSPVKQIFKCFSCGAGGGVYQFLMLYEKLTFPEAVRLLAERTGVPLPQLGTDKGGGGSEFSRSELIEVITFASEFYRQQLRSDSGKKALGYARSRGLTDDSIDRFALGYSPDAWDSLIRAAGKKGISKPKLLAAGLAVPREDGRDCYDRFRNRLMFPIIDPQNRIIAFGGRALDENERAKYINSPESPIFSKSAQLYALNWSREGIVRTSRVTLVEGYLDALIPLQSGIDNIVATLGTALTEGHVRALSRYARRATLVFDADAAGQAAAERALEVFLAQKIDVRIATIPGGKDPCDFCLTEGGESLQALVDEAPDALEYVWRRSQSAWKKSGGALADRTRATEEFLNLVVSSSAYGAIDEVRRGHLAQHIAHLLNVPAADLQQQMRRLQRRVRRSSRPCEPGPDAEYVAVRGVLAERHLLEVLLNRGEFFDKVAEQLDPSDFTDEQYRRLASCLWDAGGTARANVEELLAQEQLADLGGLITDLLDSGHRRGNYEETLDGAVQYMLYRRGKKDLEALRSAADDESLRELTRRLRRPDLRRTPRIR